LYLCPDDATLPPPLKKAKYTNAPIITTPPTAPPMIGPKLELVSSLAGVGTEIVGE